MAGRILERSMNAEEIRKFSETLGFTLTGVARIEPTPEGNFYPEWLDRGYAGEMQYLRRSAERLFGIDDPIDARMGFAIRVGRGLPRGTSGEASQTRWMD